MRSVSILNNGLNKLKQCYNSTIASDVTSDTYVQLVKELLNTMSGDRREELREKISDALQEYQCDTESEYGKTDQIAERLEE